MCHGCGPKKQKKKERKKLTKSSEAKQEAMFAGESGRNSTSAGTVRSQVVLRPGAGLELKQHPEVTERPRSSWRCHLRRQMRELQDSVSNHNKNSDPPYKATSKLAKTVGINFFRILESNIKFTTHGRTLKEERKCCLSVEEHCGIQLTHLPLPIPQLSGCLEGSSPCSCCRFLVSEVAIQSLLFFFFSFRPCPQHMEVPEPGIKSQLQL